MAPTADTLDRRYWYYGDDGYSRWYSWGRWVLLGIIIFLFFVILFSLCMRSRKRVQQGRTPITGTGWMVPPSYYQSQQQYGQEGSGAPVPPYHPQPGRMDAGYYDANGNFVAHNPMASPPPPAATYGGQQPSYGGGAPYQGSSSRPNEYEMGTVEYERHDNYAPPDYPPPAAAKR
uniref:ARAD1D11198p n=1 Tax=Blastobotrys adeninivorans TaxID=409370 RepID=A0A060T8G6_BLAAD